MPPRSNSRSAACLAASLLPWLAAAAYASDTDISQPQQYIVGGTSIPYHHYPYLVSLGTDDGAKDHTCAATLIAPDVLLTAAHCQGSFRFATLGITDRSDARDEENAGQRQTIRTGRTVIHPSYRWTPSSPDIDYDFLLIKLTSPADAARFSPVRLNRDNRIPRSDNQPLTIAGFGATDPDGSKLSDTLRHATVGYVTPATCDLADGYIAGLYYSFRGFLAPSMMCAWSATADACLGDSGGGLLIDGGRADGRNDLQVGVVSFGVGCNSPDFPGLYSRVSDQIGWIDEVVCELSADPPPEFGCARPTSRPTTARPTLRPSAAPVGSAANAPTKRSVLDFLLGGDSDDGGANGAASEPATAPVPSPTIGEEPAGPTNPPFVADLVWTDEGGQNGTGGGDDSVANNSTVAEIRNASNGSTSSEDESQMLTIIAASVGGVALVALVAIGAVLMSKRKEQRDERRDGDRAASSLCVRVLQSDAAVSQQRDHRGRRMQQQQQQQNGADPSVEIVVTN